jgi:cation diffusion facilitator family transporter
MPQKKCEICRQRVAWVGIWINLIMVAMKIIVGVISGSKACIADGLHSASNIITAFAIMVSQKISDKESNEQFPHGYGKIEFLASGFITLFIIASAVALIAVSIKHLVNEPSKPPHLVALIMAVISIGVNEMLFRYMRCVGTQFKSQTIIANAWANRADCFSSMAVIIGVVGAKMGLAHLDPIAALFVVAVIIKVSYKIMVDSVKALMDASVNDQYGEEMITIVSGVEDVRGVSKLQTRQIGQKIWAEIEILVDATISMQDAQMTAGKVKTRLLEKMRYLERVLVDFTTLEEREC